LVKGEKGVSLKASGGTASVWEKSHKKKAEGKHSLPYFRDVFNWGTETSKKRDQKEVHEGDLGVYH